MVSLDERETLAFTGQEDPAGPKERALAWTKWAPKIPAS